RNVSENPVKADGGRKRQSTRVRRDNENIRHATESLQQPRAVGMQFRRKHLGARVAPGKQPSLTAGSGTTIKNDLSSTHQQCDQRRSFILNGDSAFPIGTGYG